MKAAQYRAVRMDVKDYNQPNRKKTNFMDLTSTSGYAFLSLTSFAFLRDLKKINHKGLQIDVYPTQTEPLY